MTLTCLSLSPSILPILPSHLSSTIPPQSRLRLRAVETMSTPAAGWVDFHEPRDMLVWEERECWLNRYQNNFVRDGPPPDDVKQRALTVCGVHNRHAVCKAFNVPPPDEPTDTPSYRLRDVVVLCGLSFIRPSDSDEIEQDRATCGGARRLVSEVNKSRPEDQGFNLTTAGGGMKNIHGKIHLSEDCFVAVLKHHCSKERSSSDLAKLVIDTMRRVLQAKDDAIRAIAMRDMEFQSRLDSICEGMRSHSIADMATAVESIEDAKRDWYRKGKRLLGSSITSVALESNSSTAFPPSTISLTIKAHESTLTSSDKALDVEGKVGGSRSIIGTKQDEEESNLADVVVSSFLSPPAPEEKPEPQSGGGGTAQTSSSSRGANYDAAQRLKRELKERNSELAAAKKRASASQPPAPPPPPPTPSSIPQVPRTSPYAPYMPPDDCVSPSATGEGGRHRQYPPPPSSSDMGRGGLGGVAAGSLSVPVPMPPPHPPTALYYPTEGMGQFAPRGPIGRGRGAVRPAWVTSGPIGRGRGAVKPAWLTRMEAEGGGNVGGGGGGGGNGQHDDAP